MKDSQVGFNWVLISDVHSMAYSASTWKLNKLFCKLVNVGYKFQNFEQTIILLLLGLCRSTDMSVGEPCRDPHLIDRIRSVPSSPHIPDSRSLPSSTVCYPLCQPHLDYFLRLLRTPSRSQDGESPWVSYAYSLSPGL